MDSNTFIGEMANILEISSDKISFDDPLNKFKAWDSLGMMTFVVIFRDKVEKEIDPMKVSNCVKVSNLYDLVK